jgi:hypothetical protein
VSWWGTASRNDGASTAPSRPCSTSTTRPGESSSCAYDKGTHKQWIGSERIDWSTEIDPNNPTGLADEFVPIYSTPWWDKMNDADKGELRRAHLTLDIQPGSQPYSRRMSNRPILGIAVLACAACCIGPILGILSAIAALGVLSTAFIGLIGLALSMAAVIAIVVVRKQRHSCTVGDRETGVQITPRTTALDEHRPDGSVARRH